MQYDILKLSDVLLSVQGFMVFFGGTSFVNGIMSFVFHLQGNLIVMNVINSLHYKK